MDYRLAKTISDSIEKHICSNCATYDKDCYLDIRSVESGDVWHCRFADWLKEYIELVVRMHENEDEFSRCGYDENEDDPRAVELNKEYEAYGAVQKNVPRLRRPLRTRTARRLLPQLHILRRNITTKPGGFYMLRLLQI